MRSQATRGIFIGLALLVIGAAVLHRAGMAPDAMPRAEGHAPWFLSRAIGITAYIALSLDVALGLAMSTGALGAWITRGHAVDLHRWLSPLTLALVAGHAGVLLADGFLAFDVLDVLVPFVAPYRATAVGVGVIAAYLALVVHVSFPLRKRLGTDTWRRLHSLSFVAFAGATAHVLLTGTDALRPWALGMLVPPCLAIVALVTRRIARALHAPRGRA
jgi:sulfoxide reductase heme-binding subunit YedZ